MFLANHTSSATQISVDHNHFNTNANNSNKNNTNSASNTSNHTQASTSCASLPPAKSTMASSAYKMIPTSRSNMASLSNVGGSHKGGSCKLLNQNIILCCFYIIIFFVSFCFVKSRLKKKIALFYNPLHSWANVHDCKMRRNLICFEIFYTINLMGGGAIGFSQLEINIHKRTRIKRFIRLEN